MPQSNVSLETSKPNQTGNSTPVNQQSANANGNNSAGSKADSQQGTPNNDKPKSLSLADLFEESDDGGIRESGDASDASDDPSKPVDSIDRLTKRLGITAEQAYKIVVPMPNGAEPITIGELKDRVGELVDFEQRELAFDQRRRTAEGELLRAQNEMRDLLALVPRDQLKPELINKVRKTHEQTQARERALTLEHIPEWRDEKTRTAELTAMVELLGDYGFPDSFIDTVVDHRALKLLRDFYRMDKRIKDALAKVRDSKQPKDGRPSGKAAKPAKRPNEQQPARKQPAPTSRDRIRTLLDSSE